MSNIKLSNIKTTNFQSRNTDMVTIEGEDETKYFRSVNFVDDKGMPTQEVCLVEMNPALPRQENEKKLTTLLKLLQDGYSVRKLTKPSLPNIQTKAEVGDYLRINGAISKVMKVDTSDFSPLYELEDSRFVSDKDFTLNDVLLESEIFA